MEKAQASANIGFEKQIWDAAFAVPQYVKDAIRWLRG